MTRSGLAYAVASTASRAQNLAWERGLGISTRGRQQVAHPDAVHYATMSYRSIRRTLAALDLEPGDVFVDIGSGKGRVLCLAARTPGIRVLGVDLSTEFCATARRNALKARGLRSPIDVHEGLADEYDYSECTVFFLFEPFGLDTTRVVLSKIHADRGSQPVRIAYANPTHRQAFAEQEWLTESAFWDRDSRHDEHSVAFYRSVG